MSEHATVKIGEYTIPLIGIPKDATEDVCQECGCKFHISQGVVDMAGRTLCDNCANKKPWNIAN